MQQNVIENEFNLEYSLLATNLPGAAIEFTVNNPNYLYLDLKNSRLHVLDKITEANGTNIDANTAGQINLTLHSMFRKIGLKLNNRNVGDTIQLYLWRSDRERLLNFCKNLQESRYLWERLTKYTNGHMAVTTVGGNTAGLNGRAATFARNTVVDLIGRTHLDGVY